MTISDKSSNLYEIETTTEIDCSGSSMRAGDTCHHRVSLTNYAVGEVGVKFKAECYGTGPLLYKAGKEWGDLEFDLRPFVSDPPSVNLEEEIRHAGAPIPSAGYQKVTVKVSSPAAQIFRESYANLVLRVNLS
ncbi:hypothetical protein [Kitasatospora sp. NPDC057015]|uniref:hypothetical protein n=1 Tax=Kitasatospora sp. NPDC057015 TaxID=3346001 RepID=UPI00364458D0